MSTERKLFRFLHFRTDLGDGLRTGVFFHTCAHSCTRFCLPNRFIREHAFGSDPLEAMFYNEEELIRYLKEEKVWCYTKKLGISFMGCEPLADPRFCYRVACGVKESGMDLQIHTCAAVSETGFDMLYGVADLFIINLFSAVDFGNKPFPEYSSRGVMERIWYLDERGFPYRLRIPVLRGINEKQSIVLSDFVSKLKCLKSVILDFSLSDLTEEEKAEYRYPFQKRDVILY